MFEWINSIVIVKFNIFLGTNVQLVFPSVRFCHQSPLTHCVVRPGCWLYFCICSFHILEENNLSTFLLCTSIVFFNLFPYYLLVYHNITVNLFSIKIIQDNSSACSPSYKGGGDGDNHSSRPSWGKSYWDPISTNKSGMAVRACDLSYVGGIGR
jgi:hypothetical protein